MMLGVESQKKAGSRICLFMILDTYSYGAHKKNYTFQVHFIWGSFHLGNMTLQMNCGQDKSWFAYDLFSHQNFSVEN